MCTKYHINVKECAMHVHDIVQIVSLSFLGFLVLERIYSWVKAHIMYK